MNTPPSGLLVRHTKGTGNLFVFSSLNEFSTNWKDGLPSTIIRYTISGTEHYLLNKELFSITGGKSLLINQDEPHEGFLHYTGKPVTGFCIMLESALLNDVYHNKIAGTNALLDSPFTNGKTSFDFIEGLHDRSDILNKYLATIAGCIHQLTGTIPIELDELFFNITERLLLSQAFIKKTVNQIKADKYSTRQELYKRISKAKQILDESNDSAISIDSLASSVALSAFHFYRTFKQVYNISPHQYRIKKKMLLAKEKLLKKDTSVSELAMEIGFADVQSFSKAFKKEFAISPRVFRDGK